MNSNTTDYSTRRRRRRRAVWATLVAVALAIAVAALIRPPGGTASAKAAPANTGLPTITGTATKGSTLNATSGSWSGTAPIGFSYSWQRCDQSGSGCSPIAGANGSTYTLVDADVGSRLRVEVTATNSDGVASATSAATDVVTAGTKPANTSEPKISGSTVEGATLTGTSGSWTGVTPITYAFQWVRCGSDGGAADGSNCSVIGGATSTTYVLGGDDVGRRMRFRVIATNSVGSTTAASNATQTVTAKAPTGAPVSTGEPRISGTARQGQTLTATSGSWTGAAPISFTYQWVRCGADGGRADGSNCPAVGGATRTTYTLTGSDVGARMRVRVTARNSAGTRVATSNPTSTVAASEPSGIITLPNGERSIPVASVPSTARLVVDQVQFSPNPVRSKTQPITVRVKVKDSRGYVVRDAIVFIRSTPKVTSGGDNARTGTDGWLTYTLQPERDFQVRRGYSVQFFVKAYRTGDPVLGGVSGTRLVQVATAP